MDGACRRGSSRGDTCLHGLARGTVDPCGAASVLGRRNDSRSTGHVCRQRSRSIPPCGAVPGWGMVQSSSHGMQYCWQRGPVAADSHLHFPPQHAGFLTSGVENRSHAAAKQTARIGPWKELINCFAGNYPNSKLCQRAAGSQARLTLHAYKIWGCFTAPCGAERIAPGEGGRDTSSTVRLHCPRNSGRCSSACNGVTGLGQGPVTAGHAGSPSPEGWLWVLPSP